jgi:hypothetical protein
MYHLCLKQGAGAALLLHQPLLYDERAAAFFPGSAACFFI